LIVSWWLFMSRATIKEKLSGLVGLVAIAIATTLLADKSMVGMGTMRYAIPFGITGFTIALILLSRKSPAIRCSVALLVALVGFGVWDLMYSGPMSGDFGVTLSWRWEPTAEELFLENLATRPKTQPKQTAEAGLIKLLAKPDWPGFRGPNRDSVQPGIVLGEDWTAEAPKEIWRMRIGPGWSSITVAGSRLFTQEQRGEIEVVACYDAGSGQEIWTHKTKARFWESLGGAGPRATPTLADGKLFSLGATGLLHRLDPLTGKQIWQKDIKVDAADRKPPTWGFASSPLITNGLVIVHAGGPGDKGLLAYDVESGDLRWSAPAGDHSYSSPHLAEILGKSCVLILTNTGLGMVDPADGTLLGNYPWVMQGFRVLQPLVLNDGSVLIGSQMGKGTKRIKLSWDGKKFSAKETWASRRISPYFNDFVAHKGHLYGFDNNIFTCVDLATGDRMWKQGRYGNGQVLLLPDKDQLLVLSETGELVLLRATAKDHVELARVRVFKGKTWNHPVLIGNRLYVRNSEEAACFEMPVVEAGSGVIQKLPAPGSVFKGSINKSSGIMVSSASLLPLANMEIDNIKFELGIDDKNKVKYIQTNDPDFKTDKNIFVGMKFSDMQKTIGTIDVLQELGWGYFAELPSGWNAAFMQEPGDDSKIEWFFKR
jgi:outer membrane protein assembly factor BamB